MKSPPMPQQMQPLVSVSISPSRDSTSSASMLIAPKSLTSTARRRPPASRRTWLSSVVLPAPRKPPMTVSRMPGAVAMAREASRAAARRCSRRRAARRGARRRPRGSGARAARANAAQQLVALEDVGRVERLAELLDVRAGERLVEQQPAGSQRALQRGEEVALQVAHADDDVVGAAPERVALEVERRARRRAGRARAAARRSAAIATSETSTASTAKPSSASQRALRPSPQATSSARASTPPPSSSRSSAACSTSHCAGASGNGSKPAVAVALVPALARGRLVAHRRDTVPGPCGGLMPARHPG